MQHGEEPAPAIVQLIRPRIGPGRLWMTGEVEDGDSAVPNHCVAMGLCDGHELDEGGGAAMLLFDGTLEFFDARFGHLRSLVHLALRRNGDGLQDPLLRQRPDQALELGGHGQEPLRRHN